MMFITLIATIGMHKENQPVMEIVYRQIAGKPGDKGQVKKDTDITGKESQISRAAEYRPT